MNNIKQHTNEQKKNAANFNDFYMILNKFDLQSIDFVSFLFVFFGFHLIDAVSVCWSVVYAQYV